MHQLLLSKIKERKNHVLRFAFIIRIKKQIFACIMFFEKIQNLLLDSTITLLDRSSRILGLILYACHGKFFKIKRGS